MDALRRLVWGLFVFFCAGCLSKPVVLAPGGDSGRDLAEDADSASQRGADDGVGNGADAADSALDASGLSTEGTAEADGRGGELEATDLPPSCPAGVTGCGGECCPSLAGYGVYCNTRGHCEYKNLDNAGWRNWDVWIWLPPGTMKMGSPQDEVGREPDEEDSTTEDKLHPVSFEQGFFIGKYEIVVQHYEACVEAGPCGPAGPRTVPDGPWDINTSANGRSNHPQDGLTWQQATQFCSWAAPGGKLPSEAQWEYAAKGPVHRKYPWGDGPEPTCDNNTAVFDGFDPVGVPPWACDPCWELGCSGTKQVGSKSEGISWSGALDMAGNVGEWCDDWYNQDLALLPLDGTSCQQAGPLGLVKTIRGGCCVWGDIHLRSANRTALAYTESNFAFGARCVRPPPPPGQ